MMSKANEDQEVDAIKRSAAADLLELWATQIREGRKFELKINIGERLVRSEKGYAGVTLKKNGKVSVDLVLSPGGDAKYERNPIGDIEDQ